MNELTAEQAYELAVRKEAREYGDKSVREMSIADHVTTQLMAALVIRYGVEGHAGDELFHVNALDSLVRETLIAMSG
jgi:hypothetical protein